MTASPTTLYFGSVRGLVAIPRGSPFPEQPPSPTVITNIRTSAGTLQRSRPVWELEELDVPWGEWLALEFAVMDFSSEHRHHYAYRLGDDADEWVDLGTHREITFTNLDPGIYGFALRGRNSQGVWSVATPSSTLRIVPLFWMTIWFLALLVLSIVAAAIL